MDPLRDVKLELLLVVLLMVIGAVLIGQVDLTRWQELLALAAGSCAAAGWIVWRTRRVLRGVRGEWEESDGAQQE